MPMHTDNSPAYGRLYGSAFEGVKQYCGRGRVNVRYDFTVNVIGTSVYMRVTESYDRLRSRFGVVGHVHCLLFADVRSQ